jgi:DNA-binding NarL/FixJ family response regulator
VIDARARAGERIERICASTFDQRALRVEILGELQTSIGYDAYAWLLTDPSTTVGCAPLADVPCMPELPRLIKLKYLTTVNRWTELLSSATPVGLLHQGTGGDLARSVMWQSMLRDLRVVDVASTVFHDRNGCWAFLDLWRTGTASPFTGADAALLTAITGPITVALRRCQARTFADPTATLPHDEGPAVIMLDDDLQITARTTAATEWLQLLLPAAAGGSPIPAAAYNVAAQLLATITGIDDHASSARTYVPGRTWVTLRASRITSTRAEDAPAIAVSIEQTPAAQRLDLFSRSHALTPREQHVLGLLAQGRDTRDIASAMSISDYTVQDHLKSIFTRTTLSTRNALITAAVGTSGRDR